LAAAVVALHGVGDGGEQPRKRPRLIESVVTSLPGGARGHQGRVRPPPVDALASTGDPAASVESVATAGAVVGHRMAILSTAEAEAGGAARGAGVTTDSNLPKKPTGMSTSKRSEQQETF